MREMSGRKRQMEGKKRDDGKDRDTLAARFSQLTGTLALAHSGVTSNIGKSPSAPMNPRHAVCSGPLPFDKRPDSAFFEPTHSADEPVPHRKLE